MADANMGITEVTATAKAEISNLIQSFLIQEAKLFPTVTDYSYLAVQGNKSIACPRSPGFNAVLDKAENTSAVLDDTNAYATDVIALDKHKYIQFLLEDFASVQATVGVANDSLMKAAKQVALQMDLDIITQLKLASATAPDHLIKYIDTATNVIARADILAGRKLIVDQNMDPRECFICVGSEKESELLNISDFIDASKYGSNDPIMNGEIGKIYGMRVLVHTGLTTETLMWHPSAVGIGVQMGARVQSEYDLKELGMRYSIDSLYGVKVLDQGVRNVEISAT